MFWRSKQSEPAPGAQDNDHYPWPQVDSTGGNEADFLGSSVEGPWEGQYCVTCSANSAKGSYFGVFLKGLLKSFRPPKLKAQLCLTGWGSLNNGGGGKRVWTMLEMTSMCAGWQHLDASPPHPAFPPMGRGRKAAKLPLREGQRGWETPDSCSAGGNMALTSSSKVTVLQDRPSRIQCGVTGSAEVFPAVKTAQSKRGLRNGRAGDSRGARMETWVA